MAAKLSSHFLFIIFFFFFTIATTSAKQFTVGDTVGWRIPATNETQLYNVWASRRRFHIGDSLRFRYRNNSVTVVQKWGFYHCDSSNPIAFFNDGDTVINLDDLGTMYFISADSDRCKKGVNMMVQVMSPAPVRYIPPFMSTPPESSSSSSGSGSGSVMVPVMAPVMAPSPAEFLSTVDSREGDSTSDSVECVSVSRSVSRLFHENIASKIVMLADVTLIFFINPNISNLKLHILTLLSSYLFSCCTF
ncbi:hypothetical protein QVD17_30001 [Tagetes erecta]|uniref:Phytocyanin domain-containing protein n=1 Tax=Tagetes erecta TaxID=13708 RepID=A0AAD8NN40_TARER|nr:hypothetical protein QVD17_30001 [Tagetes erecta]